MANIYSSNDAYMRPTGFSAWIRSPGVRETVESVLIAVLLALLFRFFEAEAYVIPTGSMAPDLQGRHIDTLCPECGYSIRAGAAKERGRSVNRVTCPICQHQKVLKPNVRDDRPFSGDRILVSKFAYDFNDPERWDVIVFKYPNNGKQNFIKRLIGLPNEGLLIEEGDIYTFDHENQSFEDREICRKPAKKQKAMLHVVDDTNHIAKALIDAGWPSRWQQWDTQKQDSDWQINDELNRFTLNNPTDTARWLRYRHLQPETTDWETSLNLTPPELPKRMQGEVPAGQLITDYYAYNDTPINDMGESSPYVGLHWVGDLAFEASVEIQSDSGMLLLELVEGGIKFQCNIDVTDGSAIFDWSNSFGTDSIAMQGNTTLSTGIKGPGKYDVLFANTDNQLSLWVNGTFIGDCAYSRSGNVVPKWSQQDAGDAEPVGIGGKAIEMEVSRLQVFRDIYYTSKNLTRQTAMGDDNPSFEYVGYDSRNPRVLEAIKNLFKQPWEWDGAAAERLFASRDRDESFTFVLDDNQYLPMGDNSPQSNDARTWNGARYIDGSYLLGEALFVYWPHAKTSPLPIWPNFERMKFIQ